MLSPEAAAGDRATDMVTAFCIYNLNSLLPFAAATLEGRGN